ncbi:hypothetical protein V8F33_005454 [Rhypophila sp. PSN 637]
MATTLAPVTITYQKPGTIPPVYVAGTFTDPAWQVQEMEYDLDTNGEHVFKTETQGEPGTKIQYKFRIGDGDWWVLNDDKPTVTDTAGNKNNELEVVAPPQVLANPLPSFRAHNDAEAENGDIVAPSAAGPGDEAPQPPIMAKDIRSLSALSNSHSGADTPTLAMNAAEVADSAALLNEEEPEAEISDAEAGRIGFRRMSATPIIEVANTAAEVADSAQNLDDDIDVAAPNHPREVYDFRDDDDETDKPPLFAHECVGMKDLNGAVHEDHVHEDNPEHDDHNQNQPVEEADLDEIDLNDPTLERFPSNREEIINTVRKLETGLDEDRASFEGAPISPVVGAYRPGMEDITGDPFMSSPVLTSPIVPRPSRRLEVPRSPHGSFSSNLSSPLSLHAIDEGEEPGARADHDSSSAVLLSPPQPRTGLRLPKHPPSDEDEGIAMKANGSSGMPVRENGKSDLKQAGSPRDVNSSASQDGSPDIEATSRQPEPHHSLTTSEPSSDEHTKAQSPEIVIQAIEDIARQKSDVDKRQNGSADPVPVDSNNESDVDVGTSSAVEAIAVNGIRKRIDNPDRTGTPVSTHSATLENSRKGGWFKNFIQFLFVDLIGGFLNSLCGGRRQT